MLLGQVEGSDGRVTFSSELQEHRPETAAVELRVRGGAVTEL